MLLTKGRCTIGRLNYYLAKQASDEGFYSRYPDIDLCTAPNAICNDVARTRELRWVLGLFEWVDKVQSYDNELMGWNYMDQLKKFYDGGMRDDDFITKVTNIFTRGCHDGLCAYNDILFETERKDNFKKIINEIFNLPLTRRPTPQPISPAERVPTTAPTKMPTSPPTRKKKAKKKEQSLLAIPDSSSLCLRCRYRYLAFSAMLSMFFVV